ncbi:MAG: hypothetical protein ACP5QA_07115 [Phycisphaerae bacterium]
MDRSIFTSIERTLAQSREALDLSGHIRARLARLVERRWRGITNS